MQKFRMFRRRSKWLMEVIKMEELGKILAKDCLLITGVTDQGGMKHSPVFRAIIPYPYPLFKVHKLSKEQISKKVIPPIRLVHSTRQGPIYRLEKWCSPYLTTISKNYSASEFLLDTPIS